MDAALDELGHETYVSRETSGLLAFGVAPSHRDILIVGAQEASEDFPVHIGSRPLTSMCPLTRCPRYRPLAPLSLKSHEGALSLRASGGGLEVRLEFPVALFVLHSHDARLECTTTPIGLCPLEAPPETGMPSSSSSLPPPPSRPLLFFLVQCVFSLPSPFPPPCLLSSAEPCPPWPMVTWLLSRCSSSSRAVLLLFIIQICYHSQ